VRGETNVVLVGSGQTHRLNARNDISFAEFVAACKRRRWLFVTRFAAVRKSHTSDRRDAQLFRRSGKQDFWLVVMEIDIL
jgi:hypothetical protein